MRGFGRHESNTYIRETASPGAGKDHTEAAEALARLRAENRRNAGRPYRANSLAEAERTAGLRDANITSVGVLRENALTGKSGALSQPRRSPK